MNLVNTHKNLETVDMRIENSSSRPQQIKNYSNARILILEGLQIEKFPEEIANFPKLHTIISLNAPLRLQSHRIGNLFKLPDLEDGTTIETKTPSLKIFTSEASNSFETKILTLFHDYMLSKTKDLSGKAYNKHVENIQQLLDESNNKAHSSIQQRHHFQQLVSGMKASPLKNLIETKILPRL